MSAAVNSSLNWGQSNAWAIMGAQAIVVDSDGLISSTEGVSLVELELGAKANDLLPFTVGMLGEERVCIGPIVFGNEQTDELIGDDHDLVCTVELRVEPWDDGSHLVVLRDCQAEWALEQQLMQNRNELALTNRRLNKALEAAQSASESKTQFLSSISHDLRTPLSIIIGNGELLGAEPTLRSDPVRGDMITDINEQATALMRLIDELLDTAAAESGNISVHDETVDFNGLLEQVVRTFRGKAQTAGLHLTVEVAPLPQLLIDPRRMIQVMNNLLSNAINYTNRGGTILLRADALATGDIRVGVLDSGIGIDPEELEQIGEPFYTTSNVPVHSSAKSSGLGLHNVQRILEAYGTTFTIESEKGYGTSVWFTLPSSLVIASN